MIVHNLKVACERDQPHFRFLMSDLHLGSPHSDHQRIVSDLDRAKALGAKVLINGDIYDAIGPTDKRSDAAVLHPDMRGQKDLHNAMVDRAFGLLAPYRDIIDVIGLGNHEEAWIKYNHADPVRALIARLNAMRPGAEHQIRHGSFWGWINTTFYVDDTRKRPRHKLLYFHGAGGDSPVTKGTIDFNRKGRNFWYDCLTFGHKHNKLASVEAIQDCDDGHIVEREQLNLQTASYYSNYSEADESSPLEYSYAESKAHAPKPKGGIFLCLRPQEVAEGRWTVRQDFASDFVAPWRPKRRAA